jgi:hypothetical protein
MPPVENTQLYKNRGIEGEFATWEDNREERGRVCRYQVPPKHRFTQALHGATSQKTVFFIVTAVKNLNPTSPVMFAQI